MSLLQRSLSGAVLICVIVLLRALFLHRLPKATFLALWYVAALRLLLPFPFASPLSVYTLLAHAPRGPGAGFAAPGGLNALLPAPAAGLEAGALAQGASASLSTATAVWLVGFCLLAAYFALSYGACKRRFRRSVPVESGYVASWLQGLGRARRPQVRLCGQIAAPLSYGLLRPVILLSQRMDLEDHEALAYVLAHEYTHIRRCDALAKLLLALTLCAHWFNPLVWALYALANRDIELSCDEAVVRRFGGGAKRGYALALIRMEETKRDSPLTAHFSKIAIEERIVAIMKLKKSSALAAGLALALLAGTTAVFATGAAPVREGGIAQAPEAGGGRQAAQPLAGDAALFAEYAKHGLTFREDGNLYYNGSLVRYFWDGYELDEGACVTRYACFQEEGVLDLHTLRTVLDNGDGSLDYFGPLLAVVPDSQAAFDARGLHNPPAAPAQEAAIAEGGLATEGMDAAAACLDGLPAVAAESTDVGAGPMDEDVAVGSLPGTAVVAGSAGAGVGKTFQELFAAYGAYGVAYAPAAGRGLGNVYYNGQLVKRFIDESAAGVFTFESTDGGSLVVRAVRDAGGVLTGVAQG